MKKTIILCGAIIILVISLSGCGTTGEVESADKAVKKEVESIEVDPEVLDPVETESVDIAVLYERIDIAVAELNQKSDLYKDLLTIISGTEYIPSFDIDRIRETPPDMQPPNQLDVRDEDGEIIGEGVVMPFPYDSDDLRLVNFSWTTSGNYHVFGIDVGANLEEAEEILESFGYIAKDMDGHGSRADWYIRSNNLMFLYNNGLVTVALFVAVDDTEILEIRVYVTDPFRREPDSRGVEGVDWVS